MEDLSGRQIKGYTLRNLLGEGGFGAVYRAYQDVVDREVAIKIILPMFANDPDFIRRFETEAQLVARLEHPHMVPLYDFWRGADGAFLVMRFLRGGSLHEKLSKVHHLSPQSTSRILNQVASALTVAHRQGIIHRDLKPANILLDSDGNAYLSDFGIAKSLDQEADITQADLVVGSPAYLSPEQVRSDPVTPQSDIYSLGNVLYELLTGVHPFPNIAPTGLLFKHLNDPLPLLQEHLAELPDELNRVLQRATAKDPTDRFSDVWSLALAFRRALNEAGVEPEDDDQSPTMGITGRISVIETGSYPLVEPDNPYKGLRAFEEADSADFFGRDALILRLVAYFSERAGRATRFLAVIGPSGSGKSSAIKAGLIPKLRDGTLPNSDRWFYAEMMPGSHPFEELEAALLQVAINPPNSLLNQLQDSDRGLVRAIKRILPNDDTEIFLFIDQFEEVFTVVTDENIRATFLRSLAVAMNDPRGRIRIVITMRADFYDRPLLYSEFGKLVRENTEIVLPLLPDELEQAIAAPADRVGVVFETSLLGAIVTEVSNQPGALPLLQYGLRELFERRQDRMLTLDAYHNSGGALGALTNRAEQLYESLGTPERQAARQIFLRLVALNENGETARRRMALKELGLLGVDRAVAEHVMESFGAHRLLTFDHDPSTRAPTVEVAHEALIRGWMRLEDWLDESREDLLVHRRLRVEAAEWRRVNEDMSYLARGTRLQQYEIWARESGLALSPEEKSFLNMSIAFREKREADERERLLREEALQQRATVRLRALVSVMVVATLVAVGLASVAFTQRQNAVESEAKAQQDRLVAERNASEARSLVQASGAQQASDNHDPDLAIALILHANSIEIPPAQSQLMLADIVYQPATRIRLLSDTNSLSGGMIDDAVLSADGRLALSGDSNGTIQLWDIESRQVTQPIAGRNLRPDSVELSPNGHIAMIGAATTMEAWNLDDGTLIRPFLGHGARINDIEFHADGQHVSSASSDSTVRLWEFATGDEIQRFEGHGGPVNAIALSEDGLLLASGSADNSVRVWDTRTGRMLIRLDGHDATVNAVDMSSDGRFILSGASNGSIILWDVDSDNVVKHFHGHSGGVTSLAFSPDETLAVSASLDRSLIIWDISSGEIVTQLFGHTERVSSVDFSPDGNNVLSGSWDGSLRLWDVNNGVRLGIWTGHQDRVLSMAINSQSTLALSGSRDQSVIVWDVTSGQQVHTFLEHSSNVTGVAFNPAGTQAVSAGRDGKIILWDVMSGNVIRRFDGHGASVETVTVDPSGTTIASGGDDNMITLWDAYTGMEIRQFIGHENRVLSVAFSPGGDRLVSTSRDGTAIIWNLDTGEILHKLEAHRGIVNSAIFNSDGSQVATASSDDTIVLWDSETGQVARQFTGHDSGVTSVVFSSDDKYLLSGSADDSLILWNVTTGEAMRRFRGHDSDITAIVLSSDSKLALSGSVDETIMLWRIDSFIELLNWAKENRFVPELDCNTYTRYQIESEATCMT